MYAELLKNENLRSDQITQFIEIKNPELIKELNNYGMGNWRNIVLKEFQDFKKTSKCYDINW